MFINSAIIAGSRRLVQACVRSCSRQSTSASVAPKEPPVGSAKKVSLEARQHKTDKFDKWLLEHFKKFPKGQAPDFVPMQVMDKVRSLGRIKLNILTAVFLMLGGFFYVYQGKKERAEGNSLLKMNLEWHAEENRKFLEEQKKKEER